MSAGLLFAQGDAARLTGTVVDQTGAVIPGAVVKLLNEKTGAAREIASGTTGAFTFTNISPSTYTVTASAPGMANTEYTHIPLTVGQERALALTLSPAQVQQSVSVSAGDLVVIDVSSARVGANINEREVANMPLNGRQLSQLYLMAPGAQTAGGGSYDNIRFSGRANQQNAVRFDGVEASSIIDASPGNLNGETSTGFRLQSSLENVQEFRVESSNYPAEFGTGTGGQITVVTKSGSNDFHGSVFEYLRNNALDARNFFDSTKSPLRLNQFGASLGGPIKKDKAFFFANFEALRQRAGINLISTVPSLSARSRAVASIKPLLDAYPVGQQPSSNADLDIASLNASTALDEYFGSIRFDYAINSKLNLSTRYNRDQGTIISPLDVSGSVQRVSAVPQNAMISLQQIYSGNIVNETKFGFNGAKTRINGIAPGVNGIDISAISVSYTGTVAIPGVGGQGASAGASTLGGLIRSNSSQNGRAQPYTNYTMSFIDNLSVLKGNHSLKFGGEWRPVRLYTDRLGGTTYTYGNISALLANTPSQVQVLGDVSAPNPLHGGIATNRFLKQSYSIFYAQDEWRIRPNLTLNYGLRYEYYSVLHEANDLYTLFIVGQGLTKGPWYQSSKTNFGPRLGLSWSPSRFNNKTVLRIGGGYFYGPGQTEDQIQPIDSDRVTVTLTNVSFPVDSQKIIAGVDPSNMTGFTPRAYAPGYTLPEKVLSYTASLQQQFGGGTVLTVAYVGSQGRNLFLRSWANGIVGVSMNPTTGVGSGILEMGSRYGQMDYKTSGGTDHYDSLQTSVQRRFSKGLTLGGQWTYSHSLGNTGGSNEAQTAQNPFNFEADRGNNAFDVRHSMNATALYELPIGHGRKFMADAHPVAEALLGGWQVGGVLNARTGLPVDVTIARNDIAYRDTRNGTFVNSPILVGSQVVTVPVINNPYGGAFRNNRRPDVVAGVNPFLETGDRRYILNPAAFSTPAPGQFGNLGRWALHGPGLIQTDLTLQKKFRVSERFNVEFRSELYNIFNRANFANPPARFNNALGTAAGSLQPGQPYSLSSAGGTFGVANYTVTKDVGLGASRQIQLSLRFNF
ncbi:MAG: TonB-dependent receptor [Acidobacteria bacterium]|nr:TonB-dependent receptor [Acidobacteriota bacterium]